MCNFVPGELIAIGPFDVLQKLGDGLPGHLGQVRLLIDDTVEFERNWADDIGKLASVVLKTDPGNELYALSRLSARLSSYIESNMAAVDLNHILPMSVNKSVPDSSLRLSPYAEREASAVREFLRTRLASSANLRIAILDSGLCADFSAHREVRYLDYSRGNRISPNADLLDPLGHGTRVVSILDQILPPEVSLSVGRLPSDPDRLTVLTIAHALGDVIAREKPDVVNLSLCLRNDIFICPQCKQRVPAPTFISSILPIIIRLGGVSCSYTVTVMAAGNTGKAPNSRWLTDDVSSLLFATAHNRRGERTLYSNAPAGPRGDLHSVSAFGGDDPNDPGAQGVFIDGAHGTSFAAPFVSAVSLVTKQTQYIGSNPDLSEIGFHTRKAIEAARKGIF
jgi:hypothetical protein